MVVADNYIETSSYKLVVLPIFNAYECHIQVKDILQNISPARSTFPSSFFRSYSDIKKYSYRRMLFLINDSNFLKHWAVFIYLLNW